MEITTIKKRKTETLLKDIKRLDDKYYLLITKPTGIDFGYGMRAYHRLKNMSFPEDKVREDFNKILSELEARTYDLNTISVTYLKPYLKNFIS